METCNNRLLSLFLLIKGHLGFRIIQCPIDHSPSNRPSNLLYLVRQRPHYINQRILCNNQRPIISNSSRELKHQYKIQRCRYVNLHLSSANCKRRAQANFLHRLFLIQRGMLVLLHSGVINLLQILYLQLPFWILVIQIRILVWRCSHNQGAISLCPYPSLKDLSSLEVKLMLKKQRNSKSSWI